MTHEPAKFEVVMSNGLGRYSFLQENKLCDLDVTQNIAQHPLSHVAYMHTLFDL